MAIKKKTAGIVAGLALAGMAGAGLLATGGSAFAETTAPTPAASASTTPGTQTQGTQTQGTQTNSAEQGARGAGHTHTAVTGAEAQKVIDAVQAKNTGVTITTVRKDPDGSYDALGTKTDGTKVFYDVSADLGTITEHTR